MLVNPSVTSHSYESVCVWYKHLRFALVTTFKYTSIIQYCSLVTLLVKNLAAMLETWVQSLEKGVDRGAWQAYYPLQYSCLENSMDRGA